MKAVPDPSEARRSWDEPMTRVRVGDENSVVEHKSFRSRYFFEVAGNLVHFRNCDFSYSVIERCYFRSAIFENCKFVGAKLLESSFRSASFTGCDFQYTTIHRSNVPVADLIRNLPNFPNVRREFLQQLRANAVSVGDSSHINVLVAKELEAERDYWRAATKRSSEYYERKYSSIEGRVRARWHSIVLAVDKFAWGHGESIFQLAITTTVVLVFLGLIRWLLLAVGGVADLRLGELGQSIRFTWQVFLDLPLEPTALDGQQIWGSAVLLMRYLSIGLFISVLFRKLSKR